MPKVSVIIPNYNHAPYLQRRIESVLAQTYIDFELILLDDCSSDNSAELLLKYKDHPKVSHVIINEKNTGSPFEQWSTGFGLAKGDFIWIAESDDWCEPVLLETLVEPMLKDEKVVLSYCQSQVVTLNNEIIYKTEYSALTGLLEGNAFVTAHMFGDPVIINSGMAVFRKKVLDQIDYGFRNFKSAGDWMFWIQVASGGKVFISGKYLNYFTRHIKTVSSKAEVTGIDMQEGNIIFRWVKEQMHPSKDELKKALDQRINLYFRQLNLYENLTIAKHSFNGLKNLDQTFWRLYCSKLMRRITKMPFSSWIRHIRVMTYMVRN